MVDDKTDDGGYKFAIIVMCGFWFIFYPMIMIMAKGLITPKQYFKELFEVYYGKVK